MAPTHEPTKQSTYVALKIGNPKLHADLYLITDRLEAIRVSVAAWVNFKGLSPGLPKKEPYHEGLRLGLPKKEPFSNEPHGWQPRLQFECGDAAVLLNKQHKPVGLRFNQPNELNPNAKPGEIWDVDMKGRVAENPPQDWRTALTKNK